MKNEATNILIGRLRGAIKIKSTIRALEILEILSRKINEFEEVKKEVERTR